jgi:hypothetical protein
MRSDRYVLAIGSEDDIFTVDVLPPRGLDYGVMRAGRECVIADLPEPVSIRWVLVISFRLWGWDLGHTAPAMKGVPR